MVASLVLVATLSVLLTPANSWGIFQSAAAQPNGKVLVTVDRGKEIKVARLRRNGKLDRRFGHRGFASTGLGKRATVVDMNIGPSGEVALAAEFRGLHVSDFVQSVIQLTKNGELDHGFGVDGVAQPFTGRGAFSIGGLARSADGHLLVAADTGTAACGGVPTPDPCEYSQLVAGLNADGRLDAGFGDGGVAKTPVLWQPLRVDLALTPDGGIVAGAGTTSFQPSYVSRLTAEGALDATFGGGAGYVQTSVPVTGVAVSPSGEIYAGGANNGLFGVIALSNDGSVDQDFADAGSFVTGVDQPTGGGYGSLLRLSDGQLVLAGPVGAHCSPRDPGRRCLLSASVLRLDASGSPVAGFGDGGVATVSIARSRTSRVRRAGGAQAVDSRGGLRIATPVIYRSGETEASAVAIAALRDDGSLDPRYGKNGVSVVRVN